jgi:ADP-heptose:LPS heptosyltransferase
MGDTLMAVPLLRNCDANLSAEDQMIVIVKSRLELEILNAVPWRTNVEVWTAERGGGKNYLKLVRTAFALRLKRPSVFLAPLLVDRLRNAIWIRLISAPISVGPTGEWSSTAFTRSVENESGMHKVEYFIRCGVAAGFPHVSNPDVRLPVSPESRFQALSKMPGWGPEQRWIALGPGSGEAEVFKRWPPTHFKKLAGLLLKHSPHIRIALFGSLAERELLEAILQRADFDISRCFLYAGFDFRAALALLTQCRCMVAGCAGLLHMAAGAGIPVVGLYGPSNPGFEGAYSKYHYSIRVGLGCSPCYRKGFTQGCGHPICMSLIKPETVSEAVIHMLEGLPPPPVPWTPVTRATRPSWPTVDDSNQSAERHIFIN